MYQIVYILEHCQVTMVTKVIRDNDKCSWTIHELCWLQRTYFHKTQKLVQFRLKIGNLSCPNLYRVTDMTRWCQKYEWDLYRVKTVWQGSIQFPSLHFCTIVSSYTLQTSPIDNVPTNWQGLTLGAQNFTAFFNVEKN